MEVKYKVNCDFIFFAISQGIFPLVNVQKPRKFTNFIRKINETSINFKLPKGMFDVLTDSLGVRSSQCIIPGDGCTQNHINSLECIAQFSLQASKSWHRVLGRDEIDHDHIDLNGSCASQSSKEESNHPSHDTVLRGCKML